MLECNNINGIVINSTYYSATPFATPDESVSAFGWSTCDTGDDLVDAAAVAAAALSARVATMHDHPYQASEHCSPVGSRHQRPAGL